MSSAPTSRRPRWFRLALAGLLIVIILLARPTWHVISTALWDDNSLTPPPPGHVDDASRLNETYVAEVWPVPADPAAAEQQLAALLKRAGQEGRKVSIAGARHSMGGHTIYPGGIVIDMLPFHAMQLDEKQNLLHVQSGARWSDILTYLDARGWSVAVMQSNSSFSVGGSLSVNCHGWQFGKPPIAATVESFRLMLADGRIVRASRTENPELFSLALGGYGLFGIILDAELRVVPNERYRLEQRIVPVEDAVATFENHLQGQADVAMAYARMSIAPSRFLDEVIVNILRRDPASDGQLPPIAEPGLLELRRSLFRGSVGSNYGKELRWEAELRLQPHLSSRHFSRNQLLSESVETFQNRTAGTTDILHEYFVPAAGLTQFVGEMQRIIPRHKVDLLNVTVRSVETDADSFLRYADQPLFSFVMLYTQSREPAGEAAMEAATRELIDAALAAGGRYYLPYRLHATPEQFQRAYPQAKEFFELKRKYDPQELFQNQFYVKYGGGS